MPLVRELDAAGFSSARKLRDELRRRGVKGMRGGSWPPNMCAQLLQEAREAEDTKGD